KFFAIPCFVLPFLFQHAIQGWCPPVPILRRKGVRTRREIDAEKYALKALRGDFSNMPVNGDPTESARIAWQAAKACLTVCHPTAAITMSTMAFCVVKEDT